MAINYFNSIRKSSFIETVFSLFLSNLIAFGQPAITAIEHHYNSKQPMQFTGANNYTPVIEDTLMGDPKVRPEKSSVMPKVIEKTNVFYAREQFGTIGKSFDSDSENPLDNFFSITLPEDIDLSQYNASLAYDLYGLSGAASTTKSINNNLSYGGKIVAVGKEWSTVKENISRGQLKSGKNTIFFNRRIDENYQYKVRNLRIEFTARNEGIILSDAVVANRAGKIYLMGFAPEGIVSIKAKNQVIPVHNGIFEEVLSNIEQGISELDITYIFTDGREQTAKFPVVNKSAADMSFTASGFEDTSKVFMPEDSGFSCIDYNGALNIVVNENGWKHKNSRIIVEGLKFKDLKILDADLTNVTTGTYSGYRIRKANFPDSIPAQVHLRYDPEKIPDGYTAKDIKTFYFDKEQLNWKALPVDSLDIENNEVISTLYNNDTDYINGVIKVPDSPETGNFTPTMMSDMKYADPAAGVVSIPPPTPNSSGAATTSFPLKLPQGRNGMQPNLQLTYSSEAGNGLMGVGWNIQTSAITINTKWGVPRFDSTYESEVYSLDGEDLLFNAGTETNPIYTSANRKIDFLRNTSGDRIFYLRKEGSYQKIIRHGNNVRNYWWEVIDKQGNRSFYGGIETGPITQSTIKRPGDLVILYWALNKVIDPYGNYMEYNYDKDTVPIGTSTLSAIKFKLLNIKYAIHASNPNNYYQVIFSRGAYSTTPTGPAPLRKDIVFSARNGYFEIINDLLTEIRIYYVENGNSNPPRIRSYRFDYEEKAFQKQQLIKISEYDASSANNLFYTNTLEYYDEIGNENPLPDFLSAVSGENDSMSSSLGTMAGSVIPFFPQGSALGTSVSDGWSYGLRGGFGLGADFTNINNTVGGSLSYSKSTQDTKINLIDINGDGLPDKVYKNGGIYYRPQILDGTIASFGQELPVAGISNLSITKSNTTGAGVDARIGLSSSLSAGAGKSWSSTRSQTDNYFTDFNGDGLPDLVAGSRVHFNITKPEANPEDENPLYRKFDDLPDAAHNENPIIAGANVDSGLNQFLQLPTKDVLREEHAQFDHIKVWRAPYNGYISISGEGTLLAKNTDTATPPNTNNFRLTIERGQMVSHPNPTTIVGNQQTLGTVGLSTGFTAPANIGNVTNIHVAKGDYFFFRIHNLDYGYGGEIEWNPVISYTDDDNTNNNDNDAVIPGITQIDENGKNLKVFSAQEDYIMNNEANITVSNQDTSLKLKFGLPSFSAHQFSDDIKFVIKRVRLNSEGIEITAPVPSIWERTFDSSNSSASASDNDEINIGSNATDGNMDVFYFYAESTSNVDWSDIDWQPQLYGNVTGWQYAPVNFKTYDENVNGTKYWFDAETLPEPEPGIDWFEPFMTISHNVFVDGGVHWGSLNGLPDSDFPIEVNWVTKLSSATSSGVLNTKTFYIQRHQGPLSYKFYSDRECTTQLSDGGEHSRYSLSKLFVKLYKDNALKIYSAFYTKKREVGLADEIVVDISLVDNPSGNPYTRLNAPVFAESPTFMGLTYRGWGQFLYNGGLAFQRNENGDILPLSSSNPVHYDGIGIDLSLFDADSQHEVYDNISTDPNNLQMGGSTSVRYTFYKQNHESYTNNSILNAIATDGETEIYARYGFSSEYDNKLTARVGRFGEPSIYPLYIDPNNPFPSSTGGGIFPAFRQRSISNGTAVTGEFGGSFGGSGTDSKATSEIINQYIDLNGDRYPDIVTSGKIQYTNMLGGLSSMTAAQNFVSGDYNRDKTFGVSLPAIKANSTEARSAVPNTTTSVGTASTTTTATGNKTNTNIPSGINHSEGTSSGSKQWNDMNGDGLIDKVKFVDNDDPFGNPANAEIRVQLNTGYGFTNEFVWASLAGIDKLTSSKRSNYSVSLSVGGTQQTSSFAIGLGVAASTADMQTAIIDVTGDGLPELVMQTGDNYSYYLNTGTGFDTVPHVLYNGDDIDKDYTMSGDIFGSITWGITFPIVIPFKVTVSPTASANASINEKRTALQDFNGDGLTDVIIKGSGNSTIYAHYNRIGKTHLLKKVNMPMGGSWTIDYSESKHSYDMPQFKWLLSKIETYDGFTTDNSLRPDATLTTAEYSNPKNDRREREFLGFGTVITTQKELNGTPYRKVVKNYHNDNIYLKGAEKKSAVMTASDQVLSESTTLYNLLNPDAPVVNMNADAEHHYLQTGLSPALLDNSRLFIAVAKVTSTSYENGQSLSSEKLFTSYDNSGNLLKYVDPGTGTEDTYRSEISYYGQSETGGPSVPNGKSFPKKISVYKGTTGTTLLRERSVTYNSLGKADAITTKLNADDYNHVSFIYDDFGNVTKVTQNDNLNTPGGLAYFQEIEYDPVLKMYPIHFKNAFMEESLATYNYLFGVPVYTIDMNNQPMRTRYDTRGRVVEVTGPNELAQELANGNDGGWTIRMNYEGEDNVSNSLQANVYTLIGAKGKFEATPAGSATVPTNSQHWALTRHFDVESVYPTDGTMSSNHIFTISIVDGFGQPIQVKKSHVGPNTAGSPVAKWLVSGFDRKDTFGRTLKSYLPVTEENNYPAGIIMNSAVTTYTGYYNPSSPLPEATAVTMEYDAKDRVTKVTQPSETAASEIKYTIGDGMFVQTVENENHQINAVYTDTRGRQRKTVLNGLITTTMQYNAINELVSVTDNDNFITKNYYDLAGRKTEMDHPDRGVVTFKYDNAGRMTEQSNSNLLATAGGQKVQYHYDYARLTGVEYPQNPQNNITYIYGKPDDLHAKAENAIGRLAYQEDATGVQVFGYGKMGEVTKNLRSVAVAGYTSYWFLTQWKYDSWNRVQEITYPDREKVSYGYNRAGMLNAITSQAGVTNAPLQDVVTSITYDNVGNRQKIKYGNGVETTYKYDNRQRMSSVTLNNNVNTGAFVIKKDYIYDPLSNIIGISTDLANSSMVIAGQSQLGGPVSHTYDYDSYNRLITASGNYTGPNDTAGSFVKQDYTLGMEYNTDHTIKKKTQYQKQEGYGGSVTGQVPVPVYKNSYQLDYSYTAIGEAYVSTTPNGDYGYLQPHAPRTITETPTWLTGTVSPDDPRIKHKEYTYDRNGNQLEIKEKVGEEVTSLRKNVWDEENRLAAVNLKPDDVKSHPIAIYTYNAAGERTVRYNYDHLDAYSNGSNVGNTAKDNVMLYPSGLLMGRAIHHYKGNDRVDRIIYTKHYYAGSERLSAKTGTLMYLGSYPGDMLATVMPKLELTTQFSGLTDDMRTHGRDKVDASGVVVTSTHTKFSVPPPSLDPLPKTSEKTVLETENNGTLNYYYFHPDHLGSSAYVSNGDKKIIQHMEYLPFGETMVDEHSNSFNSPFKYNAKEFDEETGNYYYGARYYDPKLSIFISVDPLAEETGDSYGYAFNNPINLTDPSGMSAERPGDGKGDPVTPPKSTEGEITMYKFNLGNSDPKFQDFMNSFSQEDFHNIRMSIYESYMEKYTDNFAKAIYGTDGDGNVNIPEYIKEKQWAASSNDLYSSLKDAWTAKTSGVDPNSWNPLAHIMWQSTRARAVTSNDEAIKMLTVTSIELILSYVGRKEILPHPDPNALSIKILKGKGGIPNGFSISRGPGYGAKPRFDVHPLPYPSRAESRLTVPSRRIPLPHYHTGSGNNLRYHRPWEIGPDGVRRF